MATRKSTRPPRWLRERLAAKPPCPACGALDVIPIIRGLVGDDVGRLDDEGKVIMAGCLVSDDDPNWHCKACEHEWQAWPTR